ncbi:MAG: nucleotidyl transferase AbiEii/AbiGii toxin family protein, partial [Butyrivibrio sp.]|nr:nucleotidyl transferase AbiEii/AbiGii toxin family protein [Butyrivibrio sp.]
NGQVPYLEKVCKINLKKLAGVLQEMKRYAGKNDLKPSYTFYKQWGRKHKTTVQLRFSKTGTDYIEKLYATHYVRKGAEYSGSEDRGNL